jgi:cytochrome c
MRPALGSPARAIGLSIALALFAAPVLLAARGPGNVIFVGPGPAQSVTDADPERGRQLIYAYGCGACHTIPGVPAATARVAPPLIDWGTRTSILGLVPNTPERLVDWIVAPESLRPGTTMPNVGVSREDAQQMAAYLYSVR